MRIPRFTPFCGNGIYPRVLIRAGIYKEDWMRLQEMR
jgi:hypothetical protein